MKGKTKVANRMAVTVRFVGSGSKLAIDLTVTNLHSGAVQKDLIPIRIGCSSSSDEVIITSEGIDEAADEKGEADEL